jgi:hypothetical protein
MTMENTMVAAPTTAVPISTGLAVALKVLPAPSFSSSRNFGGTEVEIEAEIPLDFLLNARNLLNGGQLIDRLGVVSDRAVAVHGDRHRPHAQKAEGDQPERKHRGAIMVALATSGLMTAVS